MILDDFKQIFEIYSIESLKPKKDSDFDNKMFIFTNKLKEFLFSVIGENNKYIITFLTGKDNWLSNPFVSIINTDSSNNHKVGLYLTYLFNIDNKKLYFNLSQGKVFPKENNEQIIEKLLDFINKNSSKIPEGFTQDNESILSKEYDLNSMNEYEFKHDLNKLIEFYEFLIPTYRCLLNNYSINISNDFKEIFDNYGLEKRNSFAHNDFASKIRFNFNFDLYNILMENVSISKKFKSKIDVGTSDWINQPKALFACDDVSNFNYDEGFFVINTFDVDNQVNEIGFLLNPGEHFTFSTDFISYLFNNIKREFHDAKINKNLTITLIKLNANDLKEETLRNIFKKVIKFYNQLIGYYLEINLNENLNLKLNDIKKNLDGFKVDDSILKRICASLNAGKNIIFDGTPGTGKSELAITFSKVAEENKFINGFILTTATSDWSTFDTIGGLMPDENGRLKFHEGKFLEAIRLNKWLIIDEINRSDIDKAFGQLFTSLSHQDVELPYKYNNIPIKIKTCDEMISYFDKENAVYYIGKNWRIIGTMNVDDKDSLFDLSYAFMRRFMFIEVDLPENEKFEQIIRDNASYLSEEITSKLVNLLEINKYRKLGPAIFIDMIGYIKERLNVDYDSTSEVLSETIESFILPQLEGLDKDSLSNIDSIFKKQDINLEDKLKTLTIDF